MNRSTIYSCLCAAVLGIAPPASAQTNADALREDGTVSGTCFRVDQMFGAMVVQLGRDVVILDNSDLLNPVEVGRLTLPAVPEHWHAETRFRRLFAGPFEGPNGSDVTYIIDYFNTSNPRIRSHVSAAGPISYVQNRLTIAGSNALRLFNVFDLDNPIDLGSVQGLEIPNVIALVGGQNLTVIGDVGGDLHAQRFFAPGNGTPTATTGAFKLADGMTEGINGVELDEVHIIVGYGDGTTTGSIQLFYIDDHENPLRTAGFQTAGRRSNLDSEIMPGFVNFSPSVSPGIGGFGLKVSEQFLFSADGRAGVSMMGRTFADYWVVAPLETPGYARDLTAFNALVYAADSTSLQVIQPGALAGPQRVGMVTNQIVNDMELVGDMLYVTQLANRQDPATSSFRCYDVSDPQNPMLTLSLFTDPENPEEFGNFDVNEATGTALVNGGVADGQSLASDFVSCGAAAGGGIDFAPSVILHGTALYTDGGMGLQRWGSDPFAPEQEANAHVSYIIEDDTYLITSENSVVSFRAKGGTMEQLAQFEYPAQPHTLHREGSLLFTNLSSGAHGFDSGFFVHDLTDLLPATYVSGYGRSSETRGMRVSGDTVLLHNTAGNSLQVVDISDITQPRLKSMIVGTGKSSEPTDRLMEFGAGHAYVADPDGGLNVFDVTGSTPVTSQSTALRTLGDARSIARSSTLAAVASGHSGVQILDMSNPATPVVLGTLQAFEDVQANNVAMSGDLVLVAAGDLFYIGDVSDPMAPKVVGSTHKQSFTDYEFYFDGDIVSVAYGLEIAYVTDGQAVRAVAFGDPALPQLRGRIDDVFTGSPRSRIACIPSFVYSPTQSNGLALIDFTSVDNPQLQMNVPGDYGAAVVDGTRVIAAGADLAVVDIFDPFNPVALGSSMLPFVVDRIAVDGDLVYAITSGSSGFVAVLGIADPSNVIELARFDPPFTPSDVAIDGPYVHLLGGEAGMSILTHPAKVALSAAEYACNDEVRIIVEDFELYALDEVTVTVSDGMTEVQMELEAAEVPGRFEGSLHLPGGLAPWASDTLTVTFMDRHGETVQAGAVLACTLSPEAWIAR